MRVFTGRTKKTAMFFMRKRINLETIQRARSRRSQQDWKCPKIDQRVDIFRELATPNWQDWTGSENRAYWHQSKAEALLKGVGA